MNAGAKPHAANARPGGGMLLALLLSWCLLLTAQSLYGPVDGYVPILDQPLARCTLGYWLNALAFAPLAGHVTVGQLGRTYALLLGLLSLTSVGVIVALSQRRSVSRRSWRLVATVLLLLVLANVFNLTYLSNDLYLYRAYGAMQEAGSNPYAGAPLQHLPATQLLQVPAADQTSPYGPLALLLFRVPTAFTDAPLTQAAILKLILVAPLAALLATVGFSKRIAVEARFHWLLWVGLNPLLLLEIFQTGHLEGWTTAFLLVSVLMAGTDTLTGALLTGLLTGLACSVKLTNLVVCGALAVAVYRAARTPGARPRHLLRIVLYVVATLVTLALCYAPYGIGRGTLAALQVESAKVFLSVWSLLDPVLHLKPEFVRLAGGIGSVLALLAGALVVGRGAGVILGTIVALAIQAVLARTVFHPWYLCPLVVLAAAPWLRASRAQLAPGSDCQRTLEFTLLIGSVTSLTGGYAPFLFAQSRDPLWQNIAILISLVPACAYLAAVAFRRRQAGTVHPESTP